MIPFKTIVHGSLNGYHTWPLVINAARNYK